MPDGGKTGGRFAHIARVGPLLAKRKRHHVGGIFGGIFEYAI